jgi:hypothetical protein
MNTSRLTTSRNVVAIVFFLTAAGATTTACGSQPRADHPATQTGSSRVEQLADAPPQKWAFNPREHVAHMDVDEFRDGRDPGQPLSSADACAARLAQAWRWLGHFSDGYESYLLRQPPCSRG